MIHPSSVLPFTVLRYGLIAHSLVVLVVCLWSFISVLRASEPSPIYDVTVAEYDRLLEARIYTTLHALEAERITSRRNPDDIARKNVYITP